MKERKDWRRKEGKEKAREEGRKRETEIRMIKIKNNASIKCWVGYKEIGLLIYTRENIGGEKKIQTTQEHNLAGSYKTRHVITI